MNASSNIKSNGDAFDVFSTLWNSQQSLTSVDGLYFIPHADGGGPPMLLAVRLTFGNIVVMLSAQGDDSMTISLGGRFGDEVDCEVRSLNEVTPWKHAVSLPVMWAWRMINQQHYFDGIQFDFQETVDTSVTRIQLIVLGSAFRIYWQINPVWERMQ